MENDIQKVWKLLEQARLVQQADPTPMNPPATPDMIEQLLVRVLDVPIPEQLRESLLIHNGITDKRGEFFQMCGPGSVDWIIAAWRSDRRREAEAIDEGDPWGKPPTLIPVFHDGTAHGEIYINSDDGTMMFFDPAASTENCFWDYRYPNYAAMLYDILWHIENDTQWEWGFRMKNGKANEA